MNSSGGVRRGPATVRLRLTSERLLIRTQLRLPDKQSTADMSGQTIGEEQTLLSGSRPRVSRLRHHFRVDGHDTLGQPRQQRP
jgi:hypothetical protein